MYLFEQYGIDIGYVVIGLAGVVLLLLIMIIVMMVRNHLLRKKYKQFMEGENGRSLEKAFSDKFEAIDQLQDDVKNINGHIIKITNQLTTAYQKIGLVKYDASTSGATARVMEVSDHIVPFIRMSEVRSVSFSTTLKAV